MRTLLTILAVGSLAAHITEDSPKLLQHVKFHSSNFENILTWESGPDGTPDTVYSVEYKTYGEREWLAKMGCQRITRKSCNLTMETGNLTELYYARITAIDPGGRSATKMTDRFSSLQHTPHAHCPQATPRSPEPSLPLLKTLQHSLLSPQIGSKPRLWPRGPAYSRPPVDRLFLVYHPAGQDLPRGPCSSQDGLFPVLRIQLSMDSQESAPVPGMTTGLQ